LPTYEYACTACGHRLDAVQKFTDDALTICPECGGALRKVYGAVGIAFKGSGFYKTDSRAGSGKSNGDSRKSDDAPVKSDAKASDSGSGSDSGSKSDSGSGAGSKSDSSTKSDSSKSSSDGGGSSGSGSSGSTPKESKSAAASTT
jgi:putative FmdB family regulatory protein